MPDIKIQAYRDDQASPLGIDWDQRKSEGEFRGASEGMHVKTLAEVRVDAATGALLTDPAKLAEFIQPGDSVMDVVSRALGGFNPGNNLPPPVGAALPWNRLGLFVYDND